MKKNVKKIDVCVEMSHCAVQQRLAQCFKSTIASIKKKKRQFKYKNLGIRTEIHFKATVKARTE